MLYDLSKDGDHPSSARAVGRNSERSHRWTLTSLNCGYANCNLHRWRIMLQGCAFMLKCRKNDTTSKRYPRKCYCELTWTRHHHNCHCLSLHKVPIERKSDMWQSALEPGYQPYESSSVSLSSWMHVYSLGQLFIKYVLLTTTFEVDDWISIKRHAFRKYCHFPPLRLKQHGTAYSFRDKRC